MTKKSNTIPATLPYSIFADLIVCMVLVLIPSNLLANAENKAGIGSPELKSQRMVHDSSTFTFMGLVEPGESFRILIQPGESVTNIFIKKGDLVVQDQLLAQLGNDTLTSGKFDLLQKQNQLQKEGQQINITALEIKMKERQLSVINKEIDEESRLTSQVEGYISTAMKQLENKKMIIAGELEILGVKLAKLQQGKERYVILEKILSTQLLEVENRLSALLIKTPFPGEVVFVSPDPLRTPPGGMVCEIWGTSSYRVRGQVMQHQIEHIPIGEMVDISLDFSNKTPLKGKVTMIQQSRKNQDNRGGYPTFDVLVDVATTAQWIKPGMMVSMKKVTD